MSLDNHVSITLTIDTVGIARAGFGTGAIASHNATFPEKTRTYAGTSEVLADFPDTDSPEYLAAQAYFSQSPHAAKLKILNLSAAKPTLRYSLNVLVVRNSYKYEIKVKGQGVTPTTVSYTSDASATDGEIVAGLVSALNAVTGKNFTAAGATSPFTVTADAAGDWFSLEIVNRSDLSAVINHADPGVAAELTAIALVDADWYDLITFYNSSPYVLAAAGWTETNGRRYRADCHDTTAVRDVVSSATDAIDDLFTQQYERTMGVYHPDPSAMLSAAWAGYVLSKDPGTIIEHGKNLNGVAAVTMTTTERNNLVAKRGNSYENAGIDITFNGTSSKTGRHFDTMRDQDALKDDLQKSIAEEMFSNDKIEQSNAGIAQVQGSLESALERNTTQSPDDPKILSSFSTSVPDISELSAADKTNRLLPDIKFSGTLGGGFQKVEVIGVLSL